MSLTRLLLSFTFWLIICVVTPTHAQDNTLCVPKCRSGFMCYQSQCISKCNPACDSDEKCTDQGLCVTKYNTDESKYERKYKRKKRASGGVSFAAMVGFVLEGEVYVGGDFDVSVDTEQGFISRAQVDRSVSDFFKVGLYFNYISFDFAGSGEATIITPGITLKAPIKIDKNVELRLGIGFGYQRSSAEVGGYEVDDIQGFDIAPISELWVKIDKDISVLFIISAFSQPVGGNDDASVSWAPIPFIAGGFEF